MTEGSTRGGHPNRLARLMNRSAERQYSIWLLSPHRAVTLEVRGRVSGRTISFPVVVADHDGQQYLVSMLGEVPPGDRAPILRRYLALAPGARPHVPVDRHAPLGDFERVAGSYPVFRIVG